MIKNYIFDFGRVIVDFDEAYMTGVYVKDEAAAILVKEVVFDRLYWDRLDSGDIEDDEVKRCICERLPGKLHGAAVKVYDRWVENINLIEGIPDIIKSVKNRGGRLYLLSNISCGFAERYRDVPHINEVLSMFDGLVFSGPIHMVKPDPEIFEHILKKYSLKPEESIFIDDNPKNIEGAKALGINTYLFDGDVKRLAEYILCL